MKPEQAVRLRQGRESAGYTQKDAAVQLNVAESTYRDWEKPNGAEPASASKFIEIAQLFNISLDWWLAGKQCGPSLSKKEHSLLRAFRLCSAPLQQAISIITEALKK